MKTKNLENVNKVLSELWDFFTANTTSDETGLVEGLEEDFLMAKKDISNEIQKNYDKADYSKALREVKKIISNDEK